VKLDENPIFYKTLKQRLEDIIEARKQQRIDAAEQLRLLNELLKEVRNVGNVAQAMGMNEDQFAFYKLITDSNVNGTEQLDESKKELSSMVLETLKKLAVIDWQSKEDVQREMRRQIKRLLRIAGYGENLEDTVSEIMDLARVRLV
jgi:type I restriction enzyme, R subunit